MINAWFDLSDLSPPPIEVGGLCEVYALPLRLIEVFPSINPKTGTIDDPIQTVNNISFFSLGKIDAGRDMKVNYTRNQGGVYCEISIKFFLPEQSLSIDNTLSQLEHDSCVLIVKERNGQYKFIGSAEKGMRLLSDYNSGTSKEKRGFSEEFHGIFLNGPLYFNRKFKSIPVDDPMYVLVNSNGNIVIDKHKEAILTK